MRLPDRAERRGYPTRPAVAVVRRVVLAIGFVGAAVPLPVWAQNRPWTVEIVTSRGVTIPTHRGPFGPAFGPVSQAGLGVTLRVSSRVNLRTLLEHHEFRYDLDRFFDGLGTRGRAPFPPVAGLTNWSVGVEWLPLGDAPFRPWVTIGAARLWRGASGVGGFVSLFCAKPTLVRQDGVWTFPSAWEAPAYCAQAWREIAFSDDSYGLDLGAGIRQRITKRLRVLVEVRWLDDFAGGRTGFVPLRGALGLVF